jgi:S1-C subfamily serine protease
VRDAGSRNGTFVNGERVTEPMPVRLGDKIMLGPGGPVLIIEGLGTAPLATVSRPHPPSAAKGMGQKTVMGLISDALAKAREERKRGNRGSTAFLKAVAQEVGKDSRRKLRWLSASIVVLVLVLGGGVSVVYWLLSGEVQQSEAARLTAQDSARAEAARLRDALAEARRAAAPAAQVDSLRAELEAAQARTGQLQASLERAQSALGQQLHEGEARRTAAQQEVQRLRDELTASERRAPSQTALDSLRRAVAQAESQTASLDARMRAIRGTDFASIAQQNQGAVALITVAFGHDYYNGTGFVISPDGYMLTNWHVVADSTHPKADTIWVTLADQSASRFADVVTTSQDRDIALIRIRGYQAGPYLTSIDWTGTKARQGEPAALIGYPAGAGFARLRSAVIRTSMTAGIISRVTEDVMQFDGMTIGGSSGSPLFNADGQVISIHRAGLPQAPGFALSVPIKHAVPLLPPEVRQRLGMP